MTRIELNSMFAVAFYALKAAIELPAKEFKDIYRKQMTVANACDEVKRIAMMTPDEFKPKGAPPRPLSEIPSYWPEDLFKP